MSVDDNNPVIYRYKFTEDFMEELYKFSKIHQYDDRPDFKDAWKIWTNDNEDIIEDETRRLTNLGYEGDILVKMFKSARYYFRNKSTQKKEPAKRTTYINVNKELIEAMDNHIETQNYNKDYQPKTAFLDFCKEHEDLLQATMTNIYHQGIHDSDAIEQKIKKTYKNRYFIFVKNKQVNK
jgi:hypothetical protein